MNVVALVLAGGTSSRMGTVNKLLTNIDGKPMVTNVIDSIMRSKVTSTIVITGHEKEKVSPIVSSNFTQVVFNPDYKTGLSSSIKVGIRAIPKEADAFLICLADMPLVTFKTINLLITAFNPGKNHLICVPTVNNKSGNPVLWSARFAKDLLKIEGDQGGKRLFEQFRSVLVEVPVLDNGILIDADTPEHLTEIMKKINE